MLLLINCPLRSGRWLQEWVGRRPEQRYRYPDNGKQCVEGKGKDDAMASRSSNKEGQSGKQRTGTTERLPYSSSSDVCRRLHSHHAVPHCGHSGGERVSFLVRKNHGLSHADVAVGFTRQSIEVGRESYLLTPHPCHHSQVIQPFVHIPLGGLHPSINSFAGFTLMLANIRNSIEISCEMWANSLRFHHLFPILGSFVIRLNNLLLDTSSYDA